jgi:hypothetical protein
LELFSLKEEAANCQAAFSYFGTDVSCDSYQPTGVHKLAEANMFCDACGSQLQANQKFCSGCGKPVAAGPMIPAYPARSRIQEHVRLLAILWFAFSAFEALGGFVLLILARTLFPRLAEMNPTPGFPGSFLHVLFTLLGFFVLAKSAAGFFSGWGLLNREPWARILALVLGFLALIHVPFGTALGVYTLWVLLPASAEAEYEQYQRASAA